MKLHDLKMASLSGNDRAYGVTSVAERADSPLKGKRIVFLGSTVARLRASRSPTISALKTAQ